MDGSVLEKHVKQFIMARTGLSLSDEKQARLSEVISARVRKLRLSDYGQYHELLNRSPAEWDELIPLLTTGETYFLRDHGQCEVLETHILPHLIERNRRRRSLRVWSAGCATGEEPYSLAILIDKLLPDRNGWDILVLGTDINGQALERARRGRYGAWSFRMLGPDFRARYFRQHAGEWEVVERIRAMVTFGLGNLAADSFPSPATPLHDFDLILCRNVFIYFRPEVIAQVLNKLKAALVPGGYLLTGHTELHGQELGPLRLRLFPGTVVYERTNADSLAVRPESTAALWGLGKEPAWRGGSPESPRRDASAMAQLSSKAEALTTTVAPALTSRGASSERALAGVFAEPAPGTPIRSPSMGHGTTHDPSATTAQVAVLLAEAEALFDAADYRGAITRARRAAALDASRPQAPLLAAQAHANLGEHEPALACCRDVLGCDPLNADAYYLLAHLAEERGDLPDVKRSLEKVLYLDPSSVAAYLELGALSDAEGDLARATRMRTLALQLLSKLPADASIPHYRGVTAGELRLTVEQVVTRDRSGTDAPSWSR